MSNTRSDDKVQQPMSPDVQTQPTSTQPSYPMELVRTKIQKAAQTAKYVTYDNVSYIDTAKRGVLSGLSSSILCYTIDKYTFEYQQKNPENIIEATKNVCKKFRKGFGYAVANAVCKQTTVFFMQQYAFNLLDLTSLKDNKTLRNFTGNCVSGLLSTFITYPISVLKVRRFNEDTQPLTMNLLYKGVFTTAIRDMAHWGLMLSSQDWIKAYLDHAEQHAISHSYRTITCYTNNSLGIGLISGVFTAAVTNWLANAANREKATGFSFKVASKQIIKESGMKGYFLNGLFCTSVRMVAQATVVREVYSQLSSNDNKPKQSNH